MPRRAQPTAPTAPGTLARAMLLAAAAAAAALLLVDPSEAASTSAGLTTPRYAAPGKTGESHEKVASLLTKASRREERRIAKRQDGTVARRRAARVDLKALRRSGSDAGTSIIEIALFPDVVVRAQRVHLDDRDGARDYTWFGRQGETDQIILTVVNGNLAGAILSDGRLFRIRPTKTRAHEIVEIDTVEGSEEECGEGWATAFEAALDPVGRVDGSTFDFRDATTFKTRNGNAARGGFFAERWDKPTYTYRRLMQAWTSRPLVDNEKVTTIRVGALFTSASQALTDDIALDWQNAIDLANATFVLSDVFIYLENAGIVRTDYTESGSLITDRNRFQSQTDSHLDEAHQWRDAWKADIMTLIVADGDWNGYAYTVDFASVPGSSATAFNVVKHWPFANRFTYAHETGHVLGARHDRFVYANSDDPPAEGYNRAMVLYNHQVRTIMAYNDDCKDKNLDCTIIPFFSNPDIKFYETPIGLPLEHPFPADNHRRMNLNRGFVARYR